MRFVEVVVKLAVTGFEHRHPKLTSRERRKINSRTRMYLFMKVSRVVSRGVRLRPVRREWPSGQSAGLWAGRPGFKSWMGHYVVALSKSLHSPCFVFSDKT